MVELGGRPDELADETSVLILGQGIMGRAYADRLESSGTLCRRTGKRDWRKALLEWSGVVLVAVTNGEDSRAVVESLQSRHTLVIDLTTQTPSEANWCAATCHTKGIDYYAGGVTGGGQQVLQGEAVLLLGPTPLPVRVMELAEIIGAVQKFNTAGDACAAKLLHNFVLIVAGRALAVALRVAEERGIGSLADVIERGTAGRPVRCQSVVRDFEQPPTSTYTCALVAKDLRAMKREFPQLTNTAGLDLEGLAAMFDRGGDRPYTERAGL